MHLHEGCQLMQVKRPGPWLCVLLNVFPGYKANFL